MERDPGIEILYLDGDIVVCVKPAGVLSEEGDGGSSSMPGILRDYFAENGEKTKVFPVHRLDAGTRGVMVYARNAKAAAALSEAVREGRFVKEYEALVHGTPEGAPGEERELWDLLFKDSSKNKVFVAKTMRRGVRKAGLVYKIKEIRGDVTLLRIKLLTGRTHQIRVQFASRGYPLVGDRKYGAGDDSKNIALCAVRISFPHPAKGNESVFEIPSDL